MIYVIILYIPICLLKYQFALLLLIFGCNNYDQQKAILETELQQCKTDNAALMDSIHKIHLNRYLENKTKPKKEKKQATPKKSKSHNTPQPKKAAKSLGIYESTPTYTPKYISSECDARQCTGTTQKGGRCRNMTKNCNGRCHYH